MKKYKYILLIFLLLLSFQSAYAVENNYPEIKTPFGTYSINESSTLTDYVSYAFMMIIAMGAVILLVILIWSGVNFIMSGGDPGRISKAREMAINGFMGMIILLSVFLILNSINPGIVNTENPNLSECSEGGILLTLNDGTNITKKCINSSNGKIEQNIVGAEWFFDIGQVKEVWAFDDYDFVTNPTKIFQDATEEGGASFSNCGPREIVKGTPLSNLLGKKSIYIMPRLHGFYFYDQENYGIKNYKPFFTSQSVPNIADKYPGFENKASSFSTIADTSRVIGISYVCDIQPKAIIFEEANYSGKCSLVYSSKSNNLNNPSEKQDKLPYIGNNKMSSVIVYNMNTTELLNPDKGKIILYNALSCPEENTSGSPSLLSKCEIDVGTYQSQVLTGTDIKTICPSWDTTSYVQSIRIPDGKGAIIVMTANGSCAYFDKSKGNYANCIIDLRGYGISSEGTNLGIRPEKVIVIPTN